MFVVTIKVEDRKKKQVRVNAVHSIDGEVDFNHRCIGLVVTPGQRNAMMDSIKSAYIAFLDEQAENNSILAGLEDTATNALNAWEDTL